MARTLRLTPTPRAFARAGRGTVITPNRQAAAALGVRAESLDGLAKKTLQHARLLVAPELAAYRALRRAVAEVLSPEDVTGTLRSVRGVVREVLRAGLPEESAERAPDDPQVARLFAMVRRYRALLSERGLVDAAELTRRAAEAVRERVVLWVQGYPRLEPADLIFLDRIAADGSGLILPYATGALFTDNRDAAAFLAERDWAVEYDEDDADDAAKDANARKSGDTPPRSARDVGATVGRCYATGEKTLSESVSDRVSATVYADIEREVRGVLSEVKRLLHEQVAADDIVLMARQEERYGPLVTAIAWEYEVPVRLFYRVPAVRTRLGGWLEHLITVLKDDGAFEPTARFLAHPLSASLGSEVWQRVRKNPPQTLAAWLEPVPHLAALRWPATATTETYLEHLRQVFTTFGVRTETLGDFPSRTLLGQLQRALVSLADTDDPGTPPGAERPLADVLDDLSDLLALLDAPTESPRQGVALRTPLALYGASYDHVFVLGLAEGVLPAAIREEPLLDFHARRRLHTSGYRLESAAEAAKRERLSLFNALTGVRKTLHLSYPQQAFGRSQLPSETFARLGVTPTPPAPKPLASAEEARVVWLDVMLADDVLADDETGSASREVDTDDADAVNTDAVNTDAVNTDAVLKRARHARAVERHRESAAPPDAYDGVTGDAIDASERIFSASQLTAFGQCPYRWFAQRVLHIDEPEEADVDLDPSLRGRLYHRVLEHALTPGLDPAQQRETAREKLASAFRDAETELRLTDVPSWPVRRAEHLEQLRRVIESDSFLSDEDVVVGLEQRFDTTWRGLKVRGFVDRIDRSPDGLSLIDYKTSSQKPKGAKGADGKATLDVQLPLYLEAAAPALYPDERVASARYYSLTKTKTLAEAQAIPDALDRLVEQVQTQLAQGRFPVDPDVQYHACTYCPYDRVCRKGPRLERKRSAE